MKALVTFKENVKHNKYTHSYTHAAIQRRVTKIIMPTEWVHYSAIYIIIVYVYPLAIFHYKIGKSQIIYIRRLINLVKLEKALNVVILTML